MAELLAIPTGAPVAPVAILSGMLDAAVTAPATIATDPFAAFLATAQIAPMVAAVPTPVVASPGSPLVVQAGTAPPQDADVQTSEDAPDASGDQENAIVDPTISPALALLAALIAPKVEARRVASPAPSRETIAALAPQQAHLQFLPRAGGEQEGARPNGKGQSKSPLPLAGEIDGGPVKFTGTAELIVGALPLPLPKQTAREVPEDVAAEVTVTAELIAPIEARPASPKARMLPAPAIKDQAYLAPGAPRRADHAEQMPVALRLVTATDREAPRPDPVAAPTPLPATDTAQPDSAMPAPAADLLVQRQLVIADDSRWLDSLARDIAQSASGDTLRFKLEPVNLGSLTIAIAQGSDGAAIRMTAETHRARDLLIDAQPALVAEARANGLRISETHVDLGGGNRDNGGNTPSGGQPSLANGSTGQQAMRQDGNSRRQPDLPTPLPTQPRSAANRAPARDGGERFA